MAAKRVSSRGRAKSGPPERQPVVAERLQKVLAAAGVASRRECEELMRAGRVEVDHQTVTVLGTRVDPQRQEIRVDGVPLARPKHVYYVLNKPAGVVSTSRDPAGRTRVIDLVPSVRRLFTIGRLDRSSEGMILVTNDGELANQLTHPRYGVSKTYRAKVVGTPSDETLRQLREGVHLADGLARVASVRVRSRHPRGAELEIVLTEGRNREIRRILAKVGHKVQALRRTAIGPVKLGRLPLGEYRSLTADEIDRLRRTAGSASGSGGWEAGRKKSVSRRAKTARSRQTGARTSRSSSGPGKPKKSKGKAAGAATRKAASRKSSGAKGAGVKRSAAGSSGKRTAGKKMGTSRAGTVLDYDQASAGRSPKRVAPKRAPKKSSGKGKRRR